MRADPRTVALSSLDRRRGLRRIEDGDSSKAVVIPVQDFVRMLDATKLNQCSTFEVRSSAVYEPEPAAAHPEKHKEIIICRVVQSLMSWTYRIHCERQILDDSVVSSEGDIAGTTTVGVEECHQIDHLI